MSKGCFNHLQHGHFFCRHKLLNPEFHIPGTYPSSSQQRDIFLLANFAPKHHPLRGVALDTFKDVYTMVTIVGMSNATLETEKYLDLLEKAWFNLSPHGKVKQTNQVVLQR